MNVWINEYPIISEKANLISSFSNPNAKLYFEETGISIGTEPQDCKISNKFWEYNEFIERTRSFNVYQMKEVEMIYEPTLDDFFNKKL